MQGINCVKGEIHNVLTVLRLNQRANTNTSTLATSNNKDDNILIRGFYDLYDNLCQYTTLDTYDVTSYLAPFLSVIISNDPIYVDLFAKSTALNAIQKFLVYGLIHRQCSNVHKAVSNICVSIIHCRLDYNNLYTKDDVESVHMKLLEILCETLKLNVGEYLTDDIVCDMVYAAYNVRSNSTNNVNKSFSSSILLQRYAENILSQMILVLFARLSPEAHSTTTEILPAATGSRDSSIINNSATTTAVNQQPHVTRAEHILRNIGAVDATAVDPYSKLNKPYGITALHRILRFLSNLINPSDPHNSDSERVLGLRLVRTVLETAGHRLGAFDTLVHVIQNELCKYLLQSTNTTDLHILSLTLRIVFDLFSTVKQHLKVQLEVFFTSIHLRIGESTRSTYAQKELVIESLVEFCNEPSLIVGLYRNYDCEVGCTDLYHDLCQFLAKHSLPAGNASLNQLNLLSLEALIAVLLSINTRFCVSQHRTTHHSHTNGDTQRKPSVSLSTVTSPTSASTNDPHHLTQPSTMNRTTSNQSTISQLDLDLTQTRDELSTNRANKQKLHLAAAAFNKDGLKAFPTLQTLGVLPATVTAEFVVQFIRTTPGLELRTIGELFGSTNKFAIEILDHYCVTFDFTAVQQPGTTELSIDDALRYFLSTFLLPGEAQQIDRIIERFAAAYYKYSPGPLKSVDAAHVLAYSVIMLNTDAHNSQVAKKMTKQEFTRNTRGINDGVDLPVEYLSALYDSITTNEIKLTTTSSDSDELSIDQLTTGAKRLTGVFQTTTARVHGKNMFLVVWQPALTCIVTYMETKRLSASNNSHMNEWYEYDNKLINKLIHGVNAYSMICSCYNLNSQLNTLVISLTRIMLTFVESDVAVAESHHIKPNVLYGYDKRLQTVVQALFGVIKLHGMSHLIEAYTNVMHCVLYLQYVNVLHDNMFGLQRLVDYNNEPIEPLLHTHDDHCDHDHNAHSHSHGGDKPNGTASGGLLSWGLSLFVSADGAPATSHVLYETGATDETYIKRAADAIEQSHIAGMFAVHRQHSIQSVDALCSALMFAIKTDRAGTVYHAAVVGDNATLLCTDALFYMLTTACNSGHADAVKHISQLLRNYVETAVADTHVSMVLVEHLIVNIVTLSANVDDKATYASDVIALLLSLIRLTAAQAELLSARIIAATLSVLKQYALYIDNSDKWTALLKLITQYNTHTQCAYASYQSMTQLIDTCTSASFAPLYTALRLYLQPTDNHPVRTTQVFDALLKLHGKLDKLQMPVVNTRDTTINATQAIDSVRHKGLQREKQRLDLWLLSLSTLCKYSQDKRGHVRVHAVHALHGALLESNVSIVHPAVWQTAFEHILLPLMNNTAKLQPDVADKSATQPPVDIRMQIVTIVFATLLRYIDVITKLNELHTFWLNVVNNVVAFIAGLESAKTPADAQLVRHTADQLAHAVLILYTTGVLESVSRRSRTDVIGATMAAIDKLPFNLRDVVYGELQAGGLDSQPQKQSGSSYMPPKLNGAPQNNNFSTSGRQVRY